MDGRTGAGETTAELSAVRAETRQFLARRLKLWAIRWTIGFCVIWLAVSQAGAPRWLWWAGIGFASLTPVLALIAHTMVARRIARVRPRADTLAGGIEAGRDD